MAENSKEILNFNTETNKVLRLMINSIYTDKEIFLRELISNATDAIEKRRYLSISDESIAVPHGDYKITIHIDAKKNTISIHDNGIGMTRDEMIQNLGTIAKSGTEEFLKEVKDKKDLIGQFGVGFYSSFIVANQVDVISKRAGTVDGHFWSSDGESGYSIKHHKEPSTEGTGVILHLKDSEYEFLDKFRIKHILETYVTHINIPIEIVCGEDVEKIKPKNPIWHMDKKEITDEQYRSFYKSLSHLPDSPVLKIHYNAEGAVEFKTILFIPSMCPYDLFHPDRNIKIKLYVKKIFITDNHAEILPKYLRFVYGVVESDDLPLNISRQTLQKNGTIEKISKILVKKLFAEISSLRLQDKTIYLEFWKNFGNVLREGLCEGGNEHKDSILENSLFFTNKNTEEPISLEEYISKIDVSTNPEKKIYYCIADKLENAFSNPQMEKFNKNNVEVIFLLDPVDAFWTNVVTSYKSHELRSITRSDTQLQDDSEDEKNDDINKDEMVRLISKALEGKVKSVVISKKLTESPACITIPAGSMDINMEKFLLDQGQIKKGSLKIFEINHKNPLILTATEKLKNENTQKDGEDLINVIFEMTCVAQGEQIPHPALFAKKLSHLLEDTLSKQKENQ